MNTTNNKKIHDFKPNNNLFLNDSKPFDLILSSWDYFDKSISDKIKLIESIINEDKIYIVYTNFKRIIDFLESSESSILLNKFKNNELKIVLLPGDSFHQSNDEMEYMINNDWFFKHKNLLFYQTQLNYDYLNINQKLYIGTFIHHMLNKYLFNIDYNHNDYRQEKTLISLNNRERPDRVRLYNLYDSIIEKQNWSVSFNFKNIFLEKDLFPGNPGEANYEHVSLYTDDILKFYKESLIEIVSETNEGYVTEKTYKPLLCGVPFIIYNTNPYIISKHFELIGIDVNYFNLDYTNLKNVNEFIKELSTKNPTKIKNRYNEAFIKAQENKIKINNYFNKIYNEIKNL